MTQSIARRPERAAGTAALAVIFWAAAAVLVAAVQLLLTPRWPLAGGVATIGALLLASYLYVVVAARHAGVGHALGVGIAWLALTIVTEMAVTARVGHGWYALLGSPDRPLLRNVFLFVWVFAPALFARSEENP